MNWIKKYFLIFAVIGLIAVGGFVVWIFGQHVTPIMMYHNVHNVDEFKPNSVSPEVFDRQMAFLKDHDYNVLSFDELVTTITKGEKPPKKSVAITFDDGYDDNYVHAFGILKKYKFPAIVFIPSHKIGQPGYLTWAQVREMAQNNISIGSHTQYHEYLPDLTPEQQRMEIFGSKRFIEEQIGMPVDYFAYPIGGFSEEIKDIVKEAGYKGAVTTNRGFDRMNEDVYELNRVRFSSRDDRIDFLWMKLSGYYNLFRKPKNPF